MSDLVPSSAERISITSSVPMVPIAFFASRSGPGQAVPLASTDLATVTALNSSVVIIVNIYLLLVLLFFSVQLSAFSYQRSAVSFQLSAISSQLSALSVKALQGQRFGD